MPPTDAVRTLFAGYSPAPLNDVAVPPFPGREADEEDEGEQSGMDLEWERPKQDWSPIPAGDPTPDVPARFIDGSIASKTVGSIIVGFRRRPLIAAAISAASLELDGRTLRRGAGAHTRKVLCLYSHGIAPEDLREAHHALRAIGVDLLDRPTEDAPHDFDAMRRGARQLAMEAMEDAERTVLLADLAKPTLMDGLLERRLATVPSHDLPVVGLVKRQMTAYLPPGLQELTYALKPGERTPAFVLRTVQHVDLVNVYVRLSAQPGASPSYGVVRLTAPLAYVERRYPGESASAYLSGLAGYIYRLRHRDIAYARAGISVEPIVRVEDHLHAILPNLDALIPRMHRYLAPRPPLHSMERGSVVPGAGA
ncbi:MAG TPA: hypothetical protein VEZ14_14590 [Dehalococcoidia bacterium]|nr:hypothetical protein [Dehalococcoidia bacterium]